MLVIKRRRGDRCQREVKMAPVKKHPQVTLKEWGDEKSEAESQVRHKVRWGMGCAENGNWKSRDRRKMRIKKRGRKTCPDRKHQNPHPGAMLPMTATWELKCGEKGRCTWGGWGAGEDQVHLILQGAGTEKRREEENLVESTVGKCKKADRPAVLSNTEPDASPAGHLHLFCPGWCHHAAGHPLVSAVWV